MGNLQRIIIAITVLLGAIAYLYWDKIQSLLNEGATPANSNSPNPLQASVSLPNGMSNGNTGIVPPPYVDASGQLNGVSNVSAEVAETVVPTYVDTTTLNPSENPALTDYLAGKAKSLGTKDVSRLVWKLGGTIDWVRREQKTDSVLWPYADIAQKQGIEAGKNAIKDYILARQSIILG